MNTGTSQENEKIPTLSQSPRTIWDTPEHHTMLQWKSKQKAQPIRGFIPSDKDIQKPICNIVRESPSRCSIRIKSFQKEENKINMPDRKISMPLNKNCQNNSLNGFQNVDISSLACNEKKAEEKLKSCLKSECHPSSQECFAGFIYIV